MQNFKQLKVWTKSHQLTIDIYRTTIGFPKEERYGLVSQIRRSCSSISANIAEGSARSSDADFVRFLFCAMGSASETEYHLLLAKDLVLIKKQDYESLTQRIIEIKRMLSSLIKTIKKQVF